MKQELIKKAQEEYSEFVDKVDGMPFSELDKFVRENSLTYGMYEPKDGQGVADINYKHLLVTVADSEGVCRTNLICEIYDDDGNLVEVCENPYRGPDDTEDFLCIICGERYKDEQGHWLTPHEFVCDDCYEKLPQWVLDAIEEVGWDYLPDNVVDYLNNELHLDFVYKR